MLPTRETMALSCDGIPWTDFVPGRATLEVMGLVDPRQDEGGVVQPETYFMANSEMLAVLFSVVWLVTLGYNGGVLSDNPIVSRLGYNSFCVGLDTQPAKNFGQVMYVMAYYAYIRYAVTNMQRSFEVRRMGHITGPVMAFSVFSDVLGMASISVFSLVWVVDPWMSMYGHTLPFNQFIFCRFISVLAMMVQSSGTTRKGWAFLVIYCCISFMLPVYYTSSFRYFTITNHDLQDTLFPWYFGMALDYTWFACLPLTSLYLHIDPVYRKAMQNIAGQSSRDDVANEGSLLKVDKPAVPLQIRDLPKVFLTVVFNSVVIAGFVAAIFKNN